MDPIEEVGVAASGMMVWSPHDLEICLVGMEYVTVSSIEGVFTYSREEWEATIKHLDSCDVREGDDGND